MGTEIWIFSASYHHKIAWYENNGAADPSLQLQYSTNDVVDIDIGIWMEMAI